MEIDLTWWFFFLPSTLHVVIRTKDSSLNVISNGILGWSTILIFGIRLSCHRLSILVSISWHISCLKCQDRLGWKKAESSIPWDLKPWLGLRLDIVYLHFVCHLAKSEVLQKMSYWKVLGYKAAKLHRGLSLPSKNTSKNIARSLEWFESQCLGCLDCFT